jgi:hypothetical protein
VERERKKERKENNRKRVKTGMENAIETNRVKTANVMYSRYVKTNWIVESSVRKRETVGITKGIHHLPTSTVCKQTTHRRRFRLSTLTFLLFFSSFNFFGFQQKKTKQNKVAKQMTVLMGLPSS